MIRVTVPALFALAFGLAITATADDADRAKELRAEIAALKAKLATMESELSSLGPTMHKRTEVAKIGDLLIGVSEAEGKYVNVTDGFRVPADGPHFVVVVAVLNTSETKLTSFKGWGPNAATPGGSASLTDELGNSYKPIRFEVPFRVVGQLSGATTARPGEPVTDVLVFERPVGAARKVTLSLDASNAGGSGDIRFLLGDVRPAEAKNTELTEARRKEMLKLLEPFAERVKNGHPDGKKHVAKNVSSEIKIANHEPKAVLVWTDGKSGGMTASFEIEDGKKLRLYAVTAKSGNLTRQTADPKNHALYGWWKLLAAE
jgi:hypothetical protein